VIQKSDKKKASPMVSGPEAQKLIRQERVGLGSTTPVASAGISRPSHYRRNEPLPHGTTPGADVSEVNGSGQTPSSLVVQTPSSFDEFGIGIVADSSTSVPAATATPAISRLEALANLANATPGNNVTSSSMEMSLDYLQQ
jgi:hypothetical protein